MLMDARKRRHKRTAGGFGGLGFSGGDGAVWIQTTRVRTVAAPFRGKFKTDCEKKAQNLYHLTLPKQLPRAQACSARFNGRQGGRVVGGANL